MNRHYTDDEIALANDTDLPDMLTHLGYQVRRVGSYYTAKEMDSLRIRGRRTWYRYSEQLGGDAIAFMQHFCDMSFQEAVRYLLNFNGYTVDTSISLPKQRPRPPPQRERRPFILPPPSGNNERICAYLRGRGVGPGIIDNFIKAGLLYEGAQYHDCVFVGYDGDGEPVFAAKRGTWDGFRGDAAGSSKKIGFRLPCDPSLDNVCVFEAPVDLMSWFTLYGLPIANALALCGLYDGPLETYLRENPHIRRIALCLDNDGPGRDTAQKLSDKYQALGYEIEIHFPPVGKDWNAYLQRSGRAG